MSIKLNQTEANKTIINALEEMKADQNINLGIEEIEFPDGSKEKFYYNGEADKPFYTIEVGIEVLTDTVSELRIIQAHGFGNRWMGNDPEAIPTVVRWLRQNGIECDRAILTSTSTQYWMGRDFIKMPEVA